MRTFEERLGSVEVRAFRAMRACLAPGGRLWKTGWNRIGRTMWEDCWPGLGQPQWRAKAVWAGVRSPSGSMWRAKAWPGSWLLCSGGVSSNWVAVPTSRLQWNPGLGKTYMCLSLSTHRNLHRATRDFIGKSFLWSDSTATKEIGLALDYVVILVIESMYAWSSSVTTVAGQAEMLEWHPPKPRVWLPECSPPEGEQTLGAELQIWLAAGNTVRPSTPSVPKAFLHKLTSTRG